LTNYELKFIYLYTVIFTSSFSFDILCKMLIFFAWQDAGYHNLTPLNFLILHICL